MDACVRIEDLPHDPLSAIFEWISFEELHVNVKFVCKKWYAIVQIYHLYPRTILVNETNIDVASSQISRFGCHISRLKFLNVNSDKISEIFDGHGQFSRLRTLSIEWKWKSSLSSSRLSTSRLNIILDRCPKLDRLCLKNCLIYENLNCLVEKIAAKRIRRVSIVNNCLFVNEVERFYDLKNLNELRVLSSCSSAMVSRFCQTNSSSISSLGVFIDGWSTLFSGGDEILRSICCCTHLMKLHLCGYLQGVSSQSWAEVANLTKLRYLHVEVNRMPTRTFIDLFSNSFVDQLYSLGVRWSRPVYVDELRCLNNLQLSQLSLAFVEDTNDEGNWAIIDAVVDLSRENRSLKKFVVETYFYDVNFVARLCTASVDLRYAKIRQIFDSSNSASVYYDLQKVSDSTSFVYNLEYTMNESALVIKIQKKM